MITVKIGNSTFLCENPQEAIQIHRLSENISSTSSAGTTVSMIGTGVNDPIPEVLFIRKLVDYQGRDLDADKMAGLLGANGTFGVGPRLAKVRRVLESFSPPVLLSDYLSTRKNEDGSTTWTVKTGLTKGSV